jgi:hypothetical protein
MHSFKRGWVNAVAVKNDKAVIPVPTEALNGSFQFTVRDKTG